MDPSSIPSHLKNFRSFSLFFMSFIIFPPTASSSLSGQTISYSDHCGSYVHEANPAGGVFTRYPFLEPVTSHYTGGAKILGENPSQRSILLAPTHNLFRTNIVDTYKIQARMSFTSSNIYHRLTNLTFSRRSNYSGIARGFRRPLVFFLDGFWSVSSRKLCMVGSAPWYAKRGGPMKLEAVLKLKFARHITLGTSLVSGVLESLASPDDSSYFEPISILGVPRVAPFKYNYTLVSNEECRGGADDPQDSLLSMQSMEVCSIFTNRFTTYQLGYPSNCGSAGNCKLFGRGSERLPSFVSLYAIQCSWLDKKLRFTAEFQDRRYRPYDQSFEPNVTLIGEGTWNGTNDQLCIVACQILNQRDPLGSAHIGDCSTRFTLWFPAVRSIKNTHNVEGRIWTTKAADDIGYFEPIKLQSFDHSLKNYGSRYEFTQLEKVARSCPASKPAERKGGKYPEAYDRDMTFDMSVKYKNIASTGFAVPIFVGNRFYKPYSMIVSNSSRWEAATATSTTAASYDGPLNINYEISFRLTSFSGVSSLNSSTTNSGRVEISAEGVYDRETGCVCMIGCRNRNRNPFGKNLTEDSPDCEILVRFQLPRTGGANGSFIKGTIESLRGRSDVLYFERLDISSLTYTESAARKSIWRMDLEIIMVLVSDTLACVFLARQLLHAKKHPELVPFVSVSMMLVLTLGHMVPLLLNFEALFSNTRNPTNMPLGSGGGWLMVNEVVVRVATMVVFLLQLYLLQVTWTAKAGNENGHEKNHWAHERKTLFIALPVYIVGGSAALLMNQRYDGSSQRSMWADLRSYAGLTLDGFLFPQLILNVLQTSKGTALSRSFYIGTTFVRLLPHAYDLYRGPKNISHQFDRLYIYANPRADFYSASWDVVIACGGIAFAVVVFLQQRFGGRFMFPTRFREQVQYEMVPVASSE